MKKNNKGFTLMEMLIVVAIIGVLVAIAIPTVNKSLTKSQQAADNANIRSAISEVNAEFLLDGQTSGRTVGPMQAAWDGTTTFGGVIKAAGETGAYGGWNAGETVQVSMNTSGDKTTVSIAEGVSSGGGTTPTTQPEG